MAVLRFLWTRWVGSAIYPLVFLRNLEKRMLLKSSAVEGIGEEKLNLCQVQVLLEMFYLNGFVAKQVDDNWYPPVGEYLSEE